TRKHLGTRTEKRKIVGERATQRRAFVLCHAARCRNNRLRNYQDQIPANSPSLAGRNSQRRGDLAATFRDLCWLLCSTCEMGGGKDQFRATEIQSGAELSQTGASVRVRG